MTIDFGWEPQEVRIILSAGQNFVLEITTDDTNGIPDDATVALKIYAPGTEACPPAKWSTPLDTWNATVTGGIVSWDIVSTRSDAIPHLSFARVLLTYSGSDAYVWAKGLVHRID